MIRKILIALLTSLLTITILPISESFNIINADGHYPMACNYNEFEVSYIENDGSLSKVSCHNSLSEAKSVMKTNNDYVVRHANSYSATRIVAMNSGLAYSYPQRKSEPTLYIYQSNDKLASDRDKYKYTYITDAYEMYYYDTLNAYSDSIKNNGKGYIKVTMNGFDGYTELEYTDLVPTKYITNNIAIYVGGSHDDVCTYNHESPYKVKMKQNYYKIEKNGNYYDLVFHYFKDVPDDNGNGVDCYYNELHIDNAQNYINAGMSVGTVYYSNDGINFYADKNMKNLVAQVYGYYQYLSMRTFTNITGAQLDSFLNSVKSTSQLTGQGQTFINAQNNYGSNALMVYAMACQESGYGTSSYAYSDNNLFGWGAYDADPNRDKEYSSIKECIKQQMGVNLNWFMDCTNWRYAGTCVGNKGTGFNMQYASDPYWGAKIASLAYKIDKYVNGNNGKLTDYNTYTIGVVAENYNPYFGINTANWNTPIYKDAASNNIWHYSKFNNNYQKDLTIAFNEKSGNRYKINLANPVTNGALYVDSPIVKYDWVSSVGYVDASRVVTYNNTKVKKTATYEPFSSLRGITLTNNTLTITGIGGIQGLDFNADAGITHQVLFYDVTDESKVYAFNADNIAIDNYDLNDGYNYTYVGYTLSLDLTSANLPIGSYYTTIKTIKGDKTTESIIRSPRDEYSSKSLKVNNMNYRITTNYLYNYRVEFDVFNSELDYSIINKPSGRKSLISFDDLSFDEEVPELLNINGHAFIYYLNYNDSSEIEYTVYLVDEDGKVITLQTELTENKLDYADSLSSNYNLDNISFKSNIDVSKIDDGTYNIILKIKNGNYIDIVEFVNRSHADMDSFENETKEAHLLTSNIRDRIYLTVSTKEVEAQED